MVASAMLLDDLKWDNVTTPVHLDLGAKAAFIEHGDIRVLVLRSEHGFYTIHREDRERERYFIWHQLTHDHAQFILSKHCNDVTPDVRKPAGPRRNRRKSQKITGR